MKSADGLRFVGFEATTSAFGDPCCTELLYCHIIELDGQNKGTKIVQLEIW